MLASNEASFDHQECLKLEALDPVRPALDNSAHV